MIFDQVQTLDELSFTMLRQFAFLLCIIWVSFNGRAQEIVPKWRVTTEIVQLYLLNFNVKGERVLGRHAIGLNLGYRPAIRSGGEVTGIMGMFGGYQLQNFQNWNYQAITGGLNYKYFLSERRKGFLELELFQRRWWFDNKHVVYENHGYNFNGLRSETQDVSAVRVLYGLTYAILLKKGAMSFLIESFTGVGLRFKHSHFLTHHGTIHEIEYEDHIEKFSSTLPTFHLGIRLGVAWNK